MTGADGSERAAPAKGGSGWAGLVAGGWLAWLSALAVVKPVSDDDHWWHLLTGRYVLQHAALPDHDPFSFTFAGAPWVNWEWLSGVLLYLAWQAGGAWGLVGLRALVLCSTLWLCWRGMHEPVARASSSVSWFGLLSCSLLVLVIFGRVGDRPHHLALLPLVASMLLAGSAVKHWRLVTVLALVGVQLLWQQLHPSWLLGVAVVAAVLGDAVIADVRRHGLCPWNARRSAQLMLPLLLALPAVLHGLSYGRAFAQLAHSSSLREWAPLIEYLALDNLPLLACLVLQALVLLALALEPKQLGRLTTWLVLAMGVASWAAVRFSAVFAVLALPLVFRSLSPWVGRRATSARLSMLLTLLVGLCSTGLMLWARETYGYRFVVKVSEVHNPVGVARFMNQHALAGNVLCNTMNCAAYVAFAKGQERGGESVGQAVKVYIDGRVPQLYPERFFRDFHTMQRKPGLAQQLLAHEPVEHVVLLQAVATSTSVLSLAAHREHFVLRYFDDHGLLWSRRHPEATTTAFRFRWLIPPLVNERWFVASLADEARFERVLTELHEQLRREPSSRQAAGILAILLRHPNANSQQRQRLLALAKRHAG